MPYIGHAPTNSGNFYILDDFNGLGQDGSSSTYDQNANGTIVNFKLMVAGVAITPNVDNLIVTIDGVLQHPTDAYTISGSILTFTGAPASGVDFHVVIMGQSSTVGEGSIGADELQVSGDGTNNQLLKSDGDGTMSWINQNTVTASTAATLATARAINGVNFDGSAAITVTADANTLSNTTLKSTVVSSSLTSVGTLTGLTVTGNPIIQSDTGTLNFYNAAGTQRAFLQLSSTGLVIDTDSFLQFKPNNTEAMYINSSGFVGIQTHDNSGDLGLSNTFGAPLHILQKTASQGYGLVVQGNSNANGGRIGIGEADSNFSTRANVIDIGFDSSTDFIYSRTGKDFIFGVNSAERMRITSAGNLGIGLSNSSVNNKFQVQVATDHRIGFWGDSTYSAIQSVNDANNALKKLRFDASEYHIIGGKVGIGESSPNNAIHVAANTSSTDDGVYPVIFTENGNASGNSYAGFKTRGRIDGSNNVDCYFLADGANSLGFIGTNTNCNFEVRTNGNTAMRFTNGLDIVVPGANQNIYFGGTRISGEHDTSRRRLKQYGSGDNYMTFGCYEDNGYGYIENYGNSVGLYYWLGAAGCDMILDAHGASSIRGYEDEEFDLGESSYRFDDVYASNGTIQTSDKRMKDDIKESSLGLDFINKLNPVQYKWKDYETVKPASPDGQREEKTIKRTYKRTHYGLIAQEVEKVLTDNGLTTKDFAPIIYDEDADRYGMRYTEMIGILIKGMQELSDKVKALEDA